MKTLLITSIITFFGIASAKAQICHSTEKFIVQGSAYTDWTEVNNQYLLTNKSKGYSLSVTLSTNPKEMRPEVEKKLDMALMGNNLVVGIILKSELSDCDANSARLLQSAKATGNIWDYEISKIDVVRNK